MPFQNPQNVMDNYVDKVDNFSKTACFNAFFSGNTFFSKWRKVFTGLHKNVYIYALFFINLHAIQRKNNPDKYSAKYIFIKVKRDVLPRFIVINYFFSILSVPM